MRFLYILEFLKSKSWQYQLLGKMQSYRTIIHYWLECKMIYPIWKTVLQFLTKLNIVLSYIPVIVLLDIYPTNLKNLYPHKNAHMDIYSRPIYNCQNLEATKIHSPSCVDKQTTVYIYNGIFLVIKTIELSIQ